MGKINVNNMRPASMVLAAAGKREKKKKLGVLIQQQNDKIRLLEYTTSPIIFLQNPSKAECTKQIQCASMLVLPDDVGLDG